MSWSVSTGLVKKSELQFAIQGLNLPEEQMNREESLDQLNAAKMAALMLAMATPGPYVTVSLTGHANGVGWHKKEGMSNDFISINVYQQTEEDLKWYKLPTTEKSVYNSAEEVLEAYDKIAEAQSKLTGTDIPKENRRFENDK